MCSRYEGQQLDCSGLGAAFEEWMKRLSGSAGVCVCRLRSACPFPWSHQTYAPPSGEGSYDKWQPWNMHSLSYTPASLHRASICYPVPSISSFPLSFPTTSSFLASFHLGIASCAHFPESPSLSLFIDLEHTPFCHAPALLFKHKTLIA